MIEKSIDHRLAWLAGIIDGEGTVSMGIWRSKKPYGRYESAIWYLFIPNTSQAMLNEVATILDVLAVRYSFRPRAVRPKNLPMWSINVHHKESFRAVLMAVMPYLIAKRPHAELALRALAHRYGNGPLRKSDSRFYVGGRGGRVQHPREDADLMGMMDQMRVLNHSVPKEET